MILAIAVLVGCGMLVWLVVRTMQRRPSALTPVLTFPLIAALLSAPIVFEEGCDSSVVTGTPETGLESQYIAWCPDRCVNVPDRFTQQLVLPNGIAYGVQLTTDPIAAARFVWDEIPKEAWPTPSSSAVQSALWNHCHTVFNEYVASHEHTLLRRNPRNIDDRTAITSEIGQLMTTHGLPLQVYQALPPPKQD